MFWNFKGTDVNSMDVRTDGPWFRFRTNLILVRSFLSKNNPRCWLLDLYVTNRCYQVETTSIINWIKSSYSIWIMCKRFISDGRFQRFLRRFIANVITYDTSQWCPIRLGRIYGTTDTKCFILNQKFKRTHYLLITII